MPMLEFNLKDVMPLYEHSKGANEHSPTYDQLFEPKFHKGRELKLNADEWPDSDNIDYSAVPAALHLVKDQGVYVMSNGKDGLLKEDGSGGHVVVYAKGCNPESDEDFYEESRFLMGGDDCVISIPLDWIDALLEQKPKASKLRLRVTADSVGIAI